MADGEYYRPRLNAGIARHASGYRRMNDMPPDDNMLAFHDDAMKISARYDDDAGWIAGGSDGD